MGANVRIHKLWQVSCVVNQSYQSRKNIPLFGARISTRFLISNSFYFMTSFYSFTTKGVGCASFGKFFVINFIKVNLDLNLALKIMNLNSTGHSCYGGHGKRSDLIPSPPQEINEPAEGQQQTIFRILQRKFPPSMDMSAAANEFQFQNENEKELKLIILGVLRELIDDTYKRIREFESTSSTA